LKRQRKNFFGSFSLISFFAVETLSFVFGGAGVLNVGVGAGVERDEILGLNWM